MIRRIHFVNSVYTFTNFHRRCSLSPSEINRSSTSQNEDFLASRKRVRQRMLQRNKENFENTFGNLGDFDQMFERIKEDPEDIKEYDRDKAAPGKSTFQYIKEIKQHLKKNDYQSAIKLLEVDMVNDRKKTNGFIYKVLICHNANIGNLEEAYRLFMRFKKRGGIVTGAMYSSMFNACANCKNSFLAIEKANAVQECMRNNKYHSINTTNYNVMLKAYGRHGDLPTCLKIMDEVSERRDKVLPITYNFLLQACVSDKNSGFRHALVVWRKMLQYRTVPNVFMFNTLLKCVAECSLGDTVLIPSLIDEIKKESGKYFRRKVVIEMVGGEKKREVLKIPTDSYRKEPVKILKPPSKETKKTKNLLELSGIESNQSGELALEAKAESSGSQVEVAQVEMDNSEKSTGFELSPVQNVPPKDVENLSKTDSGLEEHGECATGVSHPLNQSELPNLLSLEPSLGSIVNFGVMTDPKHRFLLLGGVKGFLSTMSEFEANPNVKTFTLMLNLIPSTLEAEQQLMSIMESHKIKIDTAFCNVLIKRRILRDDMAPIKEYLEMMKSLKLKPDLLTFGIIAIGCKTHELGQELLSVLHSHGFRANSEILETLLRRASRGRDFEYVLTLLKVAKEDGVQLNKKFLSKLEYFIKREESARKKESQSNELEMAKEEA